MGLEGCIAAGRAWRDGELVDPDLTADELSAAARDDGLLMWVDLLAPSVDNLTELAQRLGLPPTTVEDVLSPHERPKVTRHGQSIFFTVYGTRLEVGGSGTSRRLRLARLSGIVLPNALVTIRLDDSLDLAPVLARWDENRDLLRHGPCALLHGLLDTVVDGHFETIRVFDDAIEGLEDDLFSATATNRGFVERVYGFRKDLVALRRVVLPMREVVSGVIRHRERDGSDLDHWFDDLYDHVLRAAEWTESLRDLISSVFETNLSLQDSRLNVIMKKLASWGAIIAIPTAVTGWFGQNVPYPGFAKPFGLWLSVALIVGLGGALWATFRRLDWL